MCALRSLCQKLPGDEFPPEIWQIMGTGFNWVRQTVQAYSASVLVTLQQSQIGPMQRGLKRATTTFDPYLALSQVFSTNVVCVKTQQTHANKHHGKTKQ